MYYSDIHKINSKKRNEEPTWATATMNLESVTPRERSQSQKATRYVVPLLRKVQTRQVYRDGKWVSGCRAGGRFEGK